MNECLACCTTAVACSIKWSRAPFFWLSNVLSSVANQSNLGYGYPTGCSKVEVLENGGKILSAPMVQVVWDSSAKMWLGRTSFPPKNCTSIALSDVMLEPQLESQKPAFLTDWARTGSVSQVNRLGWASQAD